MTPRGLGFEFGRIRDFHFFELLSALACGDNKLRAAEPIQKPPLTFHSAFDGQGRATHTKGHVGSGQQGKQGSSSFLGLEEYVGGGLGGDRPQSPSVPVLSLPLPQ